MYKLTIVGAGVWGSALAVQFANRGCKVNLWGRNQELISQMATSRCNQTYLPNIKLPDNIECYIGLDDAIADGDIILLVTPSASIPQLARRIAPLISDRHQGIAWACKGIEAHSGHWIHEIVSKIRPNLPIAAISGPSFAHEVALGLPTALVIACERKSFADTLAEMLHSSTLRVYTTPDIIGVECGGALKNVIAIAAGIAEGLELGENAKAALVTRGIAEVIRFTEAMGGYRETVVGLSGIGDIVLSCSSDSSRNYNFGKMIVKYGGAKKALEKNTKVIEGAETASAVLEIAQQHKIEMPICEQIALILAGRITAKQAVERLLQRQAPFRT